jgi:hypothetical protein
MTTDKRGKQVDTKQQKPRVEVEATDKSTSSTNGEPANEPAEETCDEPNNQAANNFFQAIGILSGKLIFDRIYQY